MFNIFKSSYRVSIFRVLVGYIIVLAVTIFLYNSLHHGFVDQVSKLRKNNVKQIVTISRNAIEPILNEYRSHNISKDSAIKKIELMIRAMTYYDQYGKNYIFMYDYNGVSIVQPFHSSMESLNQLELTDRKGFKIIQELLKIAQSKPEGGFATYMFTPSGTEKTQEKLTFVLGIPELKIFLATGLYMDKAYIEQEKILKTYSIWFLLVNLLILIPIILFIKELVYKNRSLRQEISNRIKTEQALTLSEHNLRTLFENMNDGIIIYKPDGEILDINNKVLEIYGAEHDMIVGKHFDDFAPSIYKFDELSTAVNERIANGEHLVFEWKAVRYNSVIEFDIDVSVTKADWYAEKVYIAVIRDISERKKNEAEINRLTKNLEAMVIQRTEQLERVLLDLKSAKSDVENALAKEKELNQMKSNFISLISHEYRTPLTGILSSTYLLNHFFEAGDLDEHKKYVDRIQKLVDSLVRILDDVLFLSKSDNGKMICSAKNFNLVQLIHQVITDAQAIDPNAHRIIFFADGAEDEWNILSDNKLIYHVIFNLLTNAVKYTITDAEISLLLSRDDSSNVIFEVIDRGIGMPKDEMEYVFEPFHRFSNVGNIQGIGVGLAIVKKCVNTLGGSIEFDSEINHGTKVTFKLPV